MKAAILAASAIILTVTQPTLAQKDQGVDQALRILNEICLNGTQARIEYDANGNINFKRFRPGAEGSFVIDKRNSKGATGIINEKLRVIADQEVRDCMQPHIDKLLSYAFGYSIEKRTIKKFDNTSLKTALLISPHNGEYTFTSFMPADGKYRYFKVQNDDFSTISIKTNKSDNSIGVTILTPSNKVITYDSALSKTEKLSAMLPPGGGFIRIGLYRAEKPTIYNVTITMEALE